MTRSKRSGSAAAWHEAAISRAGARRHRRHSSVSRRAQRVGWAKARSDVPTISQRVTEQDGGHGARAPLPTLRTSPLKTWMAGTSPAMTPV
jgi:hypothetical protein